MRRTLFTVLGAIVLFAGAVVVAVHTPSVEGALFRWAATRAAARPPADLAKSGELSALLVGTGSPLPDRARGGPCTLIAAGDHLYLVDAGLDAARNLALMRVPFDKIDAILITHFHSDHIGELGELRLQTWVAGRKVPLPVYGPPGVERVVEGFNEAYSLDAGYRIAHHGADFLPPSAEDMIAKPVAITNDATATVLEKDGLTITAIRVHHDPAKPAYGYRFDYRGRSITVSGDTAPDEDLARAAKGSDVLVHEALSPEMVAILGAALRANGHLRGAKIMHDIPGYHTSPVDAARIANEAHAKLLVYTHLLPILPDAIAERLFLRGVSDVRPDGVLLGEDGTIVRLPGGTETIEQDRIAF